MRRRDAQETVELLALAPAGGGFLQKRTVEHRPRAPQLRQGSRRTIAADSLAARLWREPPEPSSGHTCEQASNGRRKSVPPETDGAAARDLDMLEHK